MAGKRRAGGEGTIYHAKDGRWQAGIWLPSGERKRKWFHTQGEARRWLTQMQRDRDRGVPVATDERQTLAQYLSGWLAAKKATIRPGPWHVHETNVRVHITPKLGKTRLAQLTAQQVQALYADKLAAGLAPQTVKNLHSTLRCALNEAVELGVLAVNVTRRIKPPRVPRIERPVYSAEQAGTLLAAAAGLRLHALYALVLNTGMRQGELFALRWRDVDLDNGYLQVRTNLQRVRGQGLVLFEPKTEPGKRRIELSEPAIAALRAHRTRQLAERVAAGPAWDGRDLVFCSRRGRPISAANFLRDEYKPLIARAGLPPVHFHDLRHTAATLLLEQGVDILVVSQMLGHSSVAVTLGLYGHIQPTMLRRATEALNRLFGESSR